MDCNSKDCYNRFKSVVSELEALVSCNEMTWEEKHAILFYSTDLAKRVCDDGNMKIAADYHSSSQNEVLAFFNAAKGKLNYLSYYYEGK